MVTVQRSVLNTIKQTRQLELTLEHPGMIWPVMSFTADVVAWGALDAELCKRFGTRQADQHVSADLPKVPERGQVRHHVKSVASYGVTRFPISLTLQLTPEEFAAAVRQEQRAKGQRPASDVSEADRQLAALRIDYSGLDLHGMYPASFQSDDEVEDRQRQVARRTKPGMQFFEQFSKRLENEPVDAMLLSAVAGVAYI